MLFFVTLQTNAINKHTFHCQQKAAVTLNLNHDNQPGFEYPRCNIFNLNHDNRPGSEYLGCNIHLTSITTIGLIQSISVYLSSQSVGLMSGRHVRPVYDR